MVGVSAGLFKGHHKGQIFINPTQKFFRMGKKQNYAPTPRFSFRFD
jgi:hypothetical protein